MFDDGYEAYREWVLPRMIERGILPEGAALTPINPMSKGTFIEGDSMRPWDTLSADEKRLFSRMAEVYAAFSEYTDVQIGRVIDYLEESGQLDNTLIFYCADNGASGEGSPNGSVNENRFFNGYPDDIESNLAMIDRLGSPDTYNHYPTGWAVAFSTPYRMFKRYSQYAGGTCDPLVIHWPAGIRARGEVRHQYHHCTDIVPTILEACGVAFPEVVSGVKQSPLVGVSMVYSFADAGAPTRKETQYYEMISTRGIWHKGWKASAEHGPLINKGKFDEDRWQLFHTDEDRAEAHDLADQYPEKLEELKALWLEEARKYNVLPLNDYGVAGFHELEYKVATPEDGRYVYYPGTTEVPEASSARTLGGSFQIHAEVEFTRDSEGVIVSQGSRFGGYSLFVKDGQLNFVYNFLGIPPEQTLSCPAPTSGKHVVGVAFEKESVGENYEALGKMTLYVNDKAAGSGDFRTQSGHYALAGEGLAIGYDSGDPISRAYPPGYPFSGGEIFKVTYHVGSDHHEDKELKLAARLARD
jgi:arylsulfatase